MNFYDILLAKKLNEGGGGEITVEGLSVTENATYTAPEGKAYSPVVVNVPLPQNAHLLKSATTYPIAPSLLPLPKAEVTFEGNKAELYVGAEPIVVDTDNTPYVYRQSPQNKSAVDLSIVGGTIAWNQLVQISPTSISRTENGVTIVDNRDGSITVSTDANGATDATYVVLPSFSAIKDHVYYMRGMPNGGSSDTYYNYVSGLNVGYDYGTGKVGKQNVNNSVYPAPIYIKSGTVITTPITIKLNVYDLTATFGSTIADYIYSLEQATSGSGIAWLKSYGFLTKDYYAYDSGSLQSVNVASRKVVGKNLCPTPIESNVIYKNGGQYMSFTFADNGTITWSLSTTASTFFVLKVFDVTAEMVGKTFTMSYKATPSLDDNNTVMEVYYGGITHTIVGKTGTITADMVGYPLGVRFYKYGSGTYEISDVQVEFGSTATQYEPYTSTAYSFDSSKILRGIPKLSNGQMYYDGDIYESDGSVTRRYGVRAYESGDESLADAITDGTNTVYKLTTPTTESATPFTNPQLVGSTEEFVDAQTTASTPSRDVDIPCGQDSKYANSDIYISYGTSPIDMAKEHSIVPYASTYIDSNGSEDVEYWE